MAIRRLCQQNSTQDWAKRISIPLVNNNEVVQGAVVSPYFFSKCITDSSLIYPGQLFQYSEDVASFRSICESECFSNLHANFSIIRDFVFIPVLDPNLLKV